MTSETLLSTEHVCRICAEGSEDVVPIFEHPGIELNLHSKIETHLSIKVDISDNLPHQICQSCTLKLNICHDFLQTAKAADLKLRRIFKHPFKEGISSTVKSCNSVNEEFRLLSENLTDHETCRTGNLSISVGVQYELSIDDDIEVKKHVSEIEHIEHVINDSVTVSNENDFPLQSSNQNDVQINVIEQEVLSDNICKFVVKEEDHLDEIKNETLPECVDHLELRDTVDNTNRNENDPLQSKANCLQDSNYTCPFCDKVCLTKKGLDVHISTHSGVTPYLCDLCGKNFKHVNNLRCHKRVHREESLKKRHMCGLCNKGFRSKFHLTEHLNIHNNVKPYSCPICGKMFHKRIHVRQHRSTHIDEKDKFVCNDCGSRFTRRSNLTQHVRRCHAENRMFKCRICLEEFSTVSNLLSHRSIHTQENIRQSQVDSYTCQICDKIFLRKRSYDIHVRAHTAANKLWCDVCGKVLSSKSSLNYHKKSYHCSERTWHCQFCGKGYMSNKLKLTHERTHTGIKPYTCTICNKAFSGTNSLNQHMKKHLDERNFQCNLCAKKFHRRAGLKVHLRTHTGEKPFICDTCGRAFSQKNDMLRHQKIHIAFRLSKAQKTDPKKDTLEEFTCDLCNAKCDSKDELEKHKSNHNLIPVVFTVQNSDELSTITEIISEECQTVISMANVHVLRTNR